MNASFKTIALAISFAPSTKAMVAETARLASWFNSSLILIHVGIKDQSKEDEMQMLAESTKLSKSSIKIIWTNGDPANEILKICSKEQVDLLVAGALKKENLMNHYLGSVARKIMRKANCSIWMITEPTVEIEPLKNIVVDAENNPQLLSVITLASLIASKSGNAWVHIVRELKLLGLVLSARDQCTEQEYEEYQKNIEREETELVQKTLDRIGIKGIKYNIKLLSGKSGFELSVFAKKKNADLLIINAPQRRFSLFDRIFTHDQEYIFSDLPCSLLIYQPQKLK